MHRSRGSNRNRLKGRQHCSEVRFRGRSLVPAVVLVTCMVVVLYANVTLFADRKTRLSTAPGSHDQRPAGGVGAPSSAARDWESSASPGVRATDRFDAGGGQGEANSAGKASTAGNVALPEEAELPEVHVDEGEGGGGGENRGDMEKWPQGDREGDAGGQWDDSAGRQEESQALLGWGNVENEGDKKLEGVKEGEGENEDGIKAADPGAEGEVFPEGSWRADGSMREGVGVEGRDGGDKDGDRDDVEGKREEGEDGVVGAAASSTPGTDKGRGGGDGEEEGVGGVIGSASSSAPAAGDGGKKDNAEGVGDGVIGAAASSTPSAGNGGHEGEAEGEGDGVIGAVVSLEPRTDKAQGEEDGKQGGEMGGVVGAAASSTPPAGGGGGKDEEDGGTDAVESSAPDTGKDQGEGGGEEVGEVDVVGGGSGGGDVEGEGKGEGNSESAAGGVGVVDSATSAEGQEPKKVGSAGISGSRSDQLTTLAGEKPAEPGNAGGVEQGAGGEEGTAVLFDGGDGDGGDGEGSKAEKENGAGGVVAEAKGDHEPETEVVINVVADQGPIDAERGEAVEVPGGVGADKGESEDEGEGVSSPGIVAGGNEGAEMREDPAAATASVAAVVAAEAALEVMKAEGSGGSGAGESLKEGDAGPIDMGRDETVAEGGGTGEDEVKSEGAAHGVALSSGIEAGQDVGTNLKGKDAAAGVAVEATVEVKKVEGSGAGENSGDDARPTGGGSDSGEGREEQGGGLAAADAGGLEDRPGDEGHPEMDAVAEGHENALEKGGEEVSAEAVLGQGVGGAGEQKEGAAGVALVEGKGGEPGDILVAKSSPNDAQGQGEGQGASQAKSDEIVRKEDGAGSAPGTVSLEVSLEMEGVDGGGGGAGGLGGESLPNGAVQGPMECDMIKKGEGADNILNIATWKVVPGDADYRGPLLREIAASNSTHYVTLEKDLGGFNNIRMSLECAVAFAAATGRTFVIPPPFPIWNMKTSPTKRDVDLRELFTFDKLRQSGRVEVITTEEFLEREALSGNLGVSPSEDVKRLKHQAVSQYLTNVGAKYQNGLPQLSVGKEAFVMPRRMDERVMLKSPTYDLARKWLNTRTELDYLDQWKDAKVIHWRAHEARLLAPFYAFVMHADEVADRYYKRLMRDLLHYPEEVYCKASQVIALIRQEDPSGSFSSFHVRRNDFVGAYKAVNIEPAELMKISLDHVEDNEVVYIATDEKDKELFKPFRERYRVRFLSDYFERAAVGEMNQNYVGMLEQIIASHGRTFTGCWFSTFTAYILRLRGHLQKPRGSNWSYYPPKKTYHHAFHLPENPLWASEWPFGWEDLDVTGVPDLMAP